ncbi:MAG: monovalent cation/H(+) antiporter subunit G [Defluviitaleaceae bacterium]|nr:monovalent cation/H(+) antiporter subunit G [Defluviitaleaceae bacterium]
MDWQILISNILLIIGLIFMAFGVVGLFRFKDFYPRILMASKIDTVGMITLLLGLVIRHGFVADWAFSAKLLLMMFIILILNPLVAHIMVRSAYLSGYELKGEITPDGVRDESLEDEDEDFSQPFDVKGGN